MNDRSRDSHADLAQVLEAQGDIRLGVVFGSVARGSAGPQSDLDIAIDAGKPLSSERRMALIDQLAQKTGRPVDLIDLQAAGQPLLGEIFSSGTRIVGSRDAWARWVTYHLIEKADFLPLRERMLEERRKAWLDQS